MHRPRRKPYSRTLKNAASVAKASYRHLDRAASSLGRWATTDHTGFGQSLSNMPPMGFRDTLRYIVTRLLIALAGGLLSALIVFLLIAFGIPLLIEGILS